MKKIILSLIVIVISQIAFAQDSYVGEIRMFAGNYAPQGWAICNGQLLSINQNEALFTIIGTTYGGDGVNTFALPDMQGRVPIHQGTQQGTTYVIGTKAGSETRTLTANNLPPHSHQVTITQSASKQEGTSTSPEGKYPAVDGTNLYGSPVAGATNVTSNSTVVTLAPSGENQPVENRQPYLGINFIISLNGIYPTQN
ncbi:phage tail protein [Dysgonomonas sp. 520]|uniref:phage tail protein n=1 Tax=Dysgonomonas sp. 520 TaxID=2302931 RepID=UPI0013D1AA58|nr:tail fiber protein [Dysgonomonas sp. 520]NDW10799.1 phage tail protein [Dysgonomonas sp. 520]